MPLNLLLSLLLWQVTVFFSSLVHAEQSFNWTFVDLPQDGFLSECASTQISISTSPEHPLDPPFFLFAYEEFGLTTVRNLGSTVDELFWTVDHLSGTNLLITVTDSKNNSGGLNAQPFFVISNVDSSCVSSIPSPVTITTNLTRVVQTCDPVLITVNGGLSPYTVSVVIGGAPSVLNFTLDAKDNSLAWYNRATPPESFLLSVSDAKGQYAPATGFGVSSGSADVSCSPLPAAIESSSSGGSGTPFPEPSGGNDNGGASTAGHGINTVPIGTTSTSVQPFPSPSPSSNSSNNSALKANTKKSHTGAIAGGVVAGAVVLALILLACYYYLRKQRRRVISMNSGSVDLAEGPPAHVVSSSSITPFILSAPLATAALSSGRTAPSKLMVSTNTQSQTQMSGSEVSGPVTSSSGSESLQMNRQLTIRQHVDIAEVSPDVLDLPPVYSNRPPLTRPSLSDLGTSSSSYVTNK